LAQVVDVARLVADAEIAGKEQAELTRLKTIIILLKQLARLFSIKIYSCDLKKSTRTWKVVRF
jgi:hypothetical protein